MAIRSSFAISMLDDLPPLSQRRQTELALVKAPIPRGAKISRRERHFEPQ
jgi:hypothetical protein